MAKKNKNEVPERTEQGEVSDFLTDGEVARAIEHITAAIIEIENRIDRIVAALGKSKSVKGM